ncbi:MAG TPA: hypothetical protein VG324_11530 [Blastocatellia bacterium]|nr:hypothetical protein [Blastocatellia bacterium]
MKKIAIAIIGILVALYLAAYRPWRTGEQGEKDSAGGLNVAQDSSRPATGAPDVNQSVKEVQQPAKEIKQRVTDAQGAKRHVAGVKPSMAGMRRDLKLRDADLELRVIETQDVEQLTIDVTRPTKNVKVISIESEGEFEAPSSEPVYIEDVKVTSDWPTAHRINIAVPAPQECLTPYVWVEIRGQ